MGGLARVAGLFNKRKAVIILSNEDKRVTICVIETQTGARCIFRDLLNQVLTHSGTADLHGHVEVINNLSFSEILREQDKVGEPLPELFRKIELDNEANEPDEIDGDTSSEASGEKTEANASDAEDENAKTDEEDGAQFIINTIGELAAEVADIINTPGYIVYPDATYGRLLGFFEDCYSFDDEIQILTISEVLHAWLEECKLESNQPIPWFGIIGGYGLCRELAIVDNSDHNAMGRRLPSSSYRLIEKFLQPDWSNQEQVEDAFVGQVRQLVQEFDVRQILVADETLECTLLGLKEDIGEDYYVSFFNQTSDDRCNYLSGYRAAWQERMRHLYIREDWPEGVKLESALTIYAEAIATKVGQDYVAAEIRERGEKKFALGTLTNLMKSKNR